MITPPKADPAIYPKLRERALQMRIPGLNKEIVQAVLMDWHVDNGIMTVLAAIDGTGSIYLSSGGGFIGGSKKEHTIRETALFAVRLGTILKSQFTKTENFALPTPENVGFFLVTGEDVLATQASREAVLAGNDPLTILSSTMQLIVTGYRFISHKH
jgi:hypothetical protein